jgi:hypothetical protein
VLYNTQHTTGALQVILVKGFSLCDSNFNNAGIYVKCDYGQWNGKGKKKSALRIPKLGGVTELKSSTIKVSSGGNEYKSRQSNVNFKDHLFTLCPSHGGLEWADYVRLQIHCTDLLTDTVFGVVYVPIRDFNILEEEKSYPVSHKGGEKIRDALLTIRLKRLWRLPMSSSAASTGNAMNVLSSTSTDYNSISESTHDASTIKIEKNQFDADSSHNKILREFTKSSDDHDVGMKTTHHTETATEHTPAHKKGIVKNVGKGIYNGVTGGIGIASDIGMGIAGGIGAAGGIAGGIGIGIVGGIAGGIVGGIVSAGGIAGGIVGIRAAEPVGVVTLRCLLRESSEYISMWPSESVLAGALRENNSTYSAENYCVAAAYEGLLLHEVAEKELLYNRRLKPISFVTDIFNLGMKASAKHGTSTIHTHSMSSDKIVDNEKGENGEKSKRVSFITPTKQTLNEEKQAKKDEKRVRKEEKKSLALLEFNENARIEKSRLLSEYLEKVEETDKRSTMLKKQSSRKLKTSDEDNGAGNSKEKDKETLLKAGLALGDDSDDDDEEEEEDSGSSDKDSEEEGVEDDVSELEIDMGEPNPR